MIPILLIAAALTQATGAVPTDWQPLTGVTGVHYRWSRPSSNSCSVEFEAASGPAALQFQVTAKILNTQPREPIEYNPDSPIQVESTKIKPQVEDRVFSMKLLRFGRDTKDIHDCYGVVQVNAMSGSHTPNQKTQPLSETNPSGTN